MYDMALVWILLVKFDCLFDHRFGISYATLVFLPAFSLFGFVPDADQFLSVAIILLASPYRIRRQIHDIVCTKSQKIAFDEVCCN